MPPAGKPLHHEPHGFLHLGKVGIAAFDEGNGKRVGGKEQGCFFTGGEAAEARINSFRQSLEVQGAVMEAVDEGHGECDTGKGEHPPQLIEPGTGRGPGIVGIEGQGDNAGHSCPLHRCQGLDGGRAPVAHGRETAEIVAQPLLQRRCLCFGQLADGGFPADPLVACLHFRRPPPCNEPGKGGLEKRRAEPDDVPV